MNNVINTDFAELERKVLAAHDLDTAYLDAQRAGAFVMFKLMHSTVMWRTMFRSWAAHNKIGFKSFLIDGQEGALISVKDWLRVKNANWCYVPDGHWSISECNKQYVTHSERGFVGSMHQLTPLAASRTNSTCFQSIDTGLIWSAMHGNPDKLPAKTAIRPMSDSEFYTNAAYA